MLNNYLRFKKVSIKYYTSLPSNASVEWLFSYGIRRFRFNVTEIIL